MRLSKGTLVALALSVLWLTAGTWTNHSSREKEVDKYEKDVVYLCIHWADGIPIMPRQSPEKCKREHVAGNLVRARFEESGWGQDVIVALIPLGAFWTIGLLARMLIRWRYRNA